MRDRSRSSFTNRKSVCVWVSIVSSSSMVAGSWWALPQQVDGVCDRRQRVSQLMSQHGDELILPLAAGDEPRRHVRASGDVLDREQQLFGPVSIAGDPPRAQRHHLAPLWRKVPGHFPVFQRLGAGQKRAQSLVQVRDVPPGIAHFVKESAFNLFTGNLQGSPRMPNSRAGCAAFHRAPPMARGRTG